MMKNEGNIDKKSKNKKNREKLFNFPNILIFQGFYLFKVLPRPKGPGFQYIQVGWY